MATLDGPVSATQTAQVKDGLELGASDVGANDACFAAHVDGSAVLAKTTSPLSRPVQSDGYGTDVKGMVIFAVEICPTYR